MTRLVFEAQIRVRLVFGSRFRPQSDLRYEFQLAKIEDKRYKFTFDHLTPIHIDRKYH